MTKEGRRRARLAEWDDRSNRHPEETFLGRHDFLAFVLSEVVAGLLYVLTSWLLGPVVAVIVLVAVSVGFLAAYVVWRRAPEPAAHGLTNALALDVSSPGTVGVVLYSDRADGSKRESGIRLADRGSPVKMEHGRRL